MRKSLFDAIKFDPSIPLVSRAAGSALVGSLNFSISNLIQRHLKNERFGMPAGDTQTEEGATRASIDTANDELADREQTQATSDARVDQGFDATTEPLVLAADLKLVREHVQAHLLEHAGRRQDPHKPDDPSATIPDRFHIGRDFAESLEFQSRGRVKMGDAEAQAQADAFGVSVDEVRIAEARRNGRQAQFLVDNAEEIVEVYHSLTSRGSDGHPLGYEEAETVFERLPALVQLRMLVAADKGLYRQRLLELERGLNGNAEAKGNIAFLDAARREMIEIGNSWLRDGRFKREVDVGLASGQTMPAFSPAPPERKPDQRDVALAKHRAAA